MLGDNSLFFDDNYEDINFIFNDFNIKNQINNDKLNLFQENSIDENYSKKKEKLNNKNIMKEKVQNAKKAFMLKKENTRFSLQNIEITYSDGQTQQAGSGVFNSHENIYNPHQEYSYSMNYVVNLHSKADDNIDAYFKTSHIKADIVINTTGETNKVIGHIDNDVVPPSN